MVRRPIKLILVDTDTDLCNCWEHHFLGLPNVQIVHGRFEQLRQFDCLVSPANSFGLMDGGIDLAIIEYFGIELMDRVQERIVSEFLGEQPVGTSMIVETANAKHPFLAHTPTMRIPMSIAGSGNVYTAMWAMLGAVHRHNQTESKKIKSVACPGLGTLTGQVPFEQAAREMALAYRWSLEPPSMISWPFATERHAAITAS